MKQTTLFIDGEWRQGKTQRTFSVLNPSDESIINYVSEAEAADVNDAMEAAARAQKSWETMPILKKSQYFKKLIALTLENRERLAKLLTTEQGKTYNGALGEVDDTILYMENALENISRIKGDILPTLEEGDVITVEKVPYGVVVALCAWNYPLALVGRKLAPALITGNTVVLKPHELTPLATIEFFKLIEQAGFPKGVANLITGSGVASGQDLVAHKNTRLVSVTGSVGAGKAIYKTAADNISGLTLELGGKAPFIVLNDADIDKAVEAAVVSRYSNCGQVCICCDMIFVQEDIKEEFTKKLLDRVKQIKVGNPMDDTTDMGPKMCRQDIEKMDRIIESSVKAGATLAYGGKKPEGEYFEKGYWYMPSVLTDVTIDMLAAQEEIFGPLLPILSIKDFDQAVEYTNDSPYGLACYLFTENASIIRRSSRELEVGTVFVNRAITGHTHVYHSGHKMSGFNGEDGEYGIHDFLQKRVVYAKYND